MPWVPLSQSEAVWLLARIGLLVFLAGRVSRMMAKKDDDEFSLYEWGIVALMFAVAFFVLWLTSGAMK